MSYREQLRQKQAERRRQAEERRQDDWRLDAGYQNIYKHQAGE